MLGKILKRIWRGEKGITGLETAIILIAFVVVASVFAYTALSAGLFSTQRSQEAVYSGLEEARSTIQLKGSVIASGVALLDSADYPLGWVADTDATLARETTTKWEGSAAVSCLIGADMEADDEPMYHAMRTVDFTNGDTVAFWIKAAAALDGKLTFIVATGADLSGTAVESYVIDTAGTGWEKHSFDMTLGDDDSAAYFGISLSTDAEGTFYLDKVLIEDIASQGGRQLVLDSCDYVEWAEGDDTHTTMTREATDKVEGTASLKGVIGADAALNEAIVYRAMETKDWSDDDTITFWVKAEAALDSKLTFAIATGTDLQGTATQTQLINPSGTGWEQHTLTLAGDNDDSAAYFGVYLSTDAAGTFYLDGIEAKASLNQTNDPMLTYADTIVLTVANASDGEALDFVTTTDADGDGIISDEATKYHKVTVSYSSPFQQMADLAWTKSVVGKDDEDDLLEDNEKFQISVDLTNVNNSGDWPFEKVVADHPFTIEVKTDKGAVLVIERAMSHKVMDINNLN